MSRRFQFSLARSLIALGLLCIALVCYRQEKAASPTPAQSSVPPVTVRHGHGVHIIDHRVSYEPSLFGVSPYRASLWDAALGVCLALAVGVLVKRTPSFFAAAIIALLPVLWLMRTYYD